MWERERSMREELISVIIPTYNRRDKVTYAVKSVLDQTYSNIEVIIIDDASTDNTEAEIKKIKDDRIRYIYLEKNHGAAGARNVGIKEANGTYIAFQDSDDIWEKNYKCRLIKWLELTTLDLYIVLWFSLMQREGCFR